MIENLTEILNKYQNVHEKYNILREYLQSLILKILEKKGYFIHLGFLGGTALRILYDLKRFSEDLDFSLISSDTIDFNNLLSVLESELKLYNFTVNFSKKEVGAVKNSYIKFESLLYQLHLSPDKNQKLSIKLEIDTNPPQGFQTETTMISEFFLMEIRHFDLPSLFSGKCHAILFRPFAKGRDFYDLMWFITKRIKPNYLLLNNAARQTEMKEYNFDLNLLKNKLQSKIETTNFTHIKKDIQPFLENPEELKYFAKSTFLSLIKQW